MKQVAGKYEPQEAILHLWFPKPVELNDKEGLTRFFKEVAEDWVDRCPQKPYLLVNYDNVRIRPDMSTEFSEAVQSYSAKILGIFRYGMTLDTPGHFTGVAVTLGTLKMKAPANIFLNEAAAREAIRLDKARDKARDKAKGERPG